MSNIKRLLIALSGGAATDVKMTPEAEDSANRAFRESLGVLLRGKPRDREGGLAVHARYFLGREVSNRDRALLRSFPEIREAMRAAEPVFHFDDPAHPGRGWVDLREAAELTGYSEQHIRSWVLREHSEIRRRIWHRRVYVHRKDIACYARRQRKRGYGPRS